MTKGKLYLWTFIRGVSLLLGIIFGSNVSFDVNMTMLSFKDLPVGSTFIVEAFNLFTIGRHHVVTLMKR